MGKRKKSKKKDFRTIILLVLVIIACVVTLSLLIWGALAKSVKSVVTEKMAEQIMEQVIQNALESAGDPEASARAREIIDSIDEADMKEMEEIIGKYTDKDTLSDITDIMKDDGISLESFERVVQYMQESITEEDKQKMQEFFDKYSGMSALDF